MMASDVTTVPDFRALFDAAPALCLVLTPSLEIVAATDAYLRAAMRARADIVGRHVLDVVFPQNADDPVGSVRSVMASFARVLSDGRPDAMPVQKHDGGQLQARYWSRVNVPVLGATGEVQYIIHSLEDVTDVTTLKQTSPRDDFLAMLGHELRNPLAAIASATEILKRIGATTGAAGQSRAVIERQVRHLKRLIDDLLDAARVHAGKVTLNRKPIDLAQAVQQAVAVVRGTDSSVEHTIEVEAEPIGVKVDPTRMEQILVNLLSNAVKFSPAGRAIRIRVRAEGESAVVVVEDDGIGIGETTLPRIFDLFFQGERSAARSEGGLGIGLTLVKTLTELHGGSVEARSAGPGQGSTFVIRLPRVFIPGSARRQLSPVAAPPRRVLLIEDNDDARDMLKTWLVLEGHDVLEAKNGIDGVKLLISERPEVAFIDIGLPVMDGYEVARTVRQQSAHATRLVALTGYGQTEDRLRSFEAGFDDFVVKPVDPAVLSEILGDRTASFRW